MESSNTKNGEKQRPSILHIWVTASRPHTLTASICPCLVAYAASCNNPSWNLNIQISWIIFCMTVQLGTNLHNDYSDFIQGADNDKTRVGHARATAKGWLTPSQTCFAATLCLSITLLSGCYLAYVTEQLHNIFLWFLILSSIFNAFAYTAGPYPLGYIGLSNFSIAYNGLGDIFVLCYFGYVATLMIPYLLHCEGSTLINWQQQMLYATQVGLLATNIIVVNNLRDRHTDITANKLTTSVRFGRTFSLIQYVLCVSVSYILVIVDYYYQTTSSHNEQQQQQATTKNIFRLLPLISIPLAWKEIVAIHKKDGASLNPHVGGTAKVQTVFCILLSLGLTLSSR